jgi:mannose-1-phosphate guanylyltransferase
MTSSTPDSPWVVILAGGVGSRFWPVSTPSRPKQLLPLGGTDPLIEETVARVLPIVPRERIRILTGTALAGPTLAALPGFLPEHLMLEPQAKGTAPVLVWAAHTLMRRDPDAVMISLHADHHIDPPAAFRTLLLELGERARSEDRLFTIGVRPDRPETGYGYIRPGEPLHGASALREVNSFVEKPVLEKARSYVAEGYLWNTGMFVWRAGLLLDEVRAHTPELAQHLPLLDAGNVAAFFESVPALSIDEGVLERSQRVAVAEATFSWDDVGTWDAMGRMRAPDEEGNVAVGDAHLIEARNCIAWSEQGTVVVFGADDLVVVHLPDVTFVAPRARAADLKQLLDRLPDTLRRRE